MRSYLSGLSLPVSLVCALWIGPRTASATCPNTSDAAAHATQGYGLQRSGAYADAVNEFEAAYRCMPADTAADARWEYLVSLQDLISKLPEGDERTQVVCRIRGLVRDFTASVRDVTPAPESATYARDAERELDDLTNSGAACPQTPAVTPPEVAPPVTPPDPAPREPDTATEEKPADPPRPQPGRPLKIAAATVGAAALAPLAVMLAGIVRGGQLESQSADAKQMLDLQQVRDLHPAGVVANRMAYAGAIVGGALVVTSIALAVVGSRRAHSSKYTRITPTGGGVLIRF